MNGQSDRMLLSRHDWWLWASVGFGLVLAATAATMAIVRFETLGNDNYDIAFYTRVVWGMGHGERINSIVGAHDLGLHFMPVMMLYVPLSWLFSIPHTLLVTQAIALGATAVLLYRAGVVATGKCWVGLALALAWCLHPSVLQIGAAEFHPGSLAVPALVAALTALHQRKQLAGVVLLVVACMTREDVALVAAGVGVVVALDADRRKLGLGIASAAVAWFLLYVFVIQPLYLPDQGSLQAHFAGWGDDTGQVAVYMLTHPADVLGRLFGLRDLTYLLAILLSLGGLCLLEPRWLIPAIPPLLINMLSSFDASLDIGTHYVTLTLPPLFFAAALALGRIGRFKLAGRRALALAAVMLVLASLRSHMTDGATPISERFESHRYVMDRDEGTLAWYARTIVEFPTARVMAPAAVIGHLAERRHIHSWAFDHPDVDVAILDMTQRQWVQLEPGLWREPMEREMQRVDSDPAFGTWRINPPFRVAWRGLEGGGQRCARVSPRAVPAAATAQDTGWEGFVDLVALEAALTRETEQFSGDYRSLFMVRTTFYWRALADLPEGLLLRVETRGTSKTHVRFHLPTWGIRDTSTWNVGELIRDEQWSTSPGGWPLSALESTVVFVDGEGRPYPHDAKPIALTW